MRRRCGEEEPPIIAGFVVQIFLQTKLKYFLSALCVVVNCNSSLFSGQLDLLTQVMLDFFRLAKHFICCVCV